MQAIGNFDADRAFLAFLNATNQKDITGEIFYAVDDSDKTLSRYKENFGQNVLVFSKKDIASRFDEFDNFEERGTVFYARNAAFDLAQSVGYRYFFQFDDDYKEFDYIYNF